MAQVNMTGYKDYSSDTLWSGEEQWIKASYSFATHGGAFSGYEYNVAKLPAGYVITAGFVKCSIDVAGTLSTLEIGVTGSTACVVAQTAEASFVPNYVKAFAGLQVVDTTNNRVFMTIGTANLTAGALDVWLKVKKA